jgi:hypothetical protein
LRDIKPMVELPQAAEAFPWTAVALVAITLLAIVATFLWWRSKRRRLTIAADPAAEAMANLAAAEPMLDAGDSEAFTMAVSNTLRRYIGHQLGHQAQRQTTEEFLSSLAEEPDGSALRGKGALLHEFLRECDLVKFARGQLDRAGRVRLLNIAREFVEATSQPTQPELTVAA